MTAKLLINNILYVMVKYTLDVKCLDRLYEISGTNPLIQRKNLCLRRRNNEGSEGDQGKLKFHVGHCIQSMDGIIWANLVTERRIPPMDELVMLRTRIFRVVALPTWELPTCSMPAQIGTSYPNGVSVLAPRPLEHPRFFTSTSGGAIPISEPANDAILVIEDHL